MKWGEWKDYQVFTEIWGLGCGQVGVRMFLANGAEGSPSSNFMLLKAIGTPPPPCLPTKWCLKEKCNHVPLWSTEQRTTIYNAYACCCWLADTRRVAFDSERDRLLFHNTMTAKLHPTNSTLHLIPLLHILHPLSSCIIQSYIINPLSHVFSFCIPVC